MPDESPDGSTEDAGLRWLLRTPDPIVCAMLAAGPLPSDAIMRAWQDAATRTVAEEPYPGGADLRASLARLTDAGYLCESSGEYSLTQTGTELANQVTALYRALGSDASADAADGDSSS